MPPAVDTGTASAGTLWDGEGQRSRAQGFTTCWKRESCTATFESLVGAGRQGSTGLHFHGEGTGLIGIGLDLPSARVERGVDLSTAGAISFWLRVVAPSPDQAPPPGATWVSLRGKGTRSSRMVRLHDCDPGFRDGSWHKIVVPLAALHVQGATNFDPRDVTGFSLDTDTPTPRNFDLFMDDITAEPVSAGGESMACRRSVPDFDALTPLPQYPCPEGARDTGPDAAVVLDAFRQHREAMRQCYEPRRLEDPDVVGTVTVAFSVDPDGTVRNPSALCTSLPDPAVVACVVAQAAKVRFPPSEKGIPAARFRERFY